jgi:thiamine transport system ATP-binding protein
MLMLDEPLSALDRGLRDRLGGDLARVLRATSTTAILVTHDESEAATIADRTLRMRAGEIVDS